MLKKKLNSLQDLSNDSLQNVSSFLTEADGSAFLNVSSGIFSALLPGILDVSNHISDALDHTVHSDFFTKFHPMNIKAKLEKFGTAYLDLTFAHWNAETDSIEYLPHSDGEIAYLTELFGCYQSGSVSLRYCVAVLAVIRDYLLENGHSRRWQRSLEALKSRSHVWFVLTLSMTPDSVTSELRDWLLAIKKDAEQLISELSADPSSLKASLCGAVDTLHGASSSEVEVTSSCAEAALRLRNFLAELERPKRTVTQLTVQQEMQQDLRYLQQYLQQYRQQTLQQEMQQEMQKKVQLMQQDLRSIITHCNRVMEHIGANASSRSPLSASYEETQLNRLFLYNYRNANPQLRRRFDERYGLVPVLR